MAQDNGSMALQTAIDLGEDLRSRDFEAYLTRIAEARYVMRKVLRILNDSAREHGLEALEHQALVQVAGTPEGSIAIHALAERLDIVPAFGSRIVKQLEQKRLIHRHSLPTDKRVTLTSVTSAGQNLLREIDESVHRHMGYFQAGLGSRDRASALAIFAFYVGEPADSVLAETIRTLLD